MASQSAVGILVILCFGLFMSLSLGFRITAAVTDGDQNESGEFGRISNDLPLSILDITGGDGGMETVSTGIQDLPAAIFMAKDFLQKK